MNTAGRRLFLLGLLAAARCTKDEATLDEGRPGNSPIVRLVDAPPLDLELDQSIDTSLVFELGERPAPLGLVLDQGYVEDGREAFGTEVRYRSPDFETDLLGIAKGATARLDLDDGTHAEPVVKALPMEHGWLALVLPAGPPGRLVLQLGDPRFPRSGPFAPHFSIDLEWHAFLVPAGNGPRERIEGSRLLRTRARRADWLRIVGPADVPAGEAFEVTVTFQSGASTPRTSSPVAECPELKDLEWLAPDGRWTKVASRSLPDSVGARGRIVAFPEGFAEGVLRPRIRVADQPSIEGIGDPVEVHGDEPSQRRFVGSLHNHTAFGGHAASTPRRLFAYAREVSRLDFCGSTEHSESPGFDWDATVRLLEELDEEGRFVVFAGYEWTHPLAGHRHVVFADAAAAQPVRIAKEGASARWRVADDLATLAELVGHDRNALIVVHHPMLWAAGVQTAFDYGTPDELPRQRLAEIYSWHGSSLGEEDDPFPLHDFVGQRAPTQEQGILAALGRGHRFGGIADGDNHLGMPGSLVGVEWTKGRRYAYQGLTVVRAPRLARDALFAALESGACYGTTGARILLDTQLARPGELLVRVHGSGPLRHVRVRTPSRLVRTVDCAPLPPSPSTEPVARSLDASLGVWDLEERFTIPTDEACVVEVLQVDEHAAWEIVLPPS